MRLRRVPSSTLILLISLLIVATTLSTGTAVAADGGVIEAAQTSETQIDLLSTEVYPLVFPIVGDTYYSDTFGACRDGCSRTHEGIDILTYGWKGLPIVAAHDGVITRTTESSGRDCCAIWGLKNSDGWETW
ncbi:MAG: M23 family metallopeptidase, partial [Actinomycetia bacterium]|nr:M23 family metallopeptidase [Actinomycetes bacterium]